MIDWFKRLPGFKKTPAGLERTILRRLPKVFAYGTLLLLLPSVGVHLAAFVDASLASDPRAVGIVDIVVVALVFVHWNVVLTVAIGAVIVMVMKGPAYMADAFPADTAKPQGSS